MLPERYLLGRILYRDGVWITKKAGQADWLDDSFPTTMVVPYGMAIYQATPKKRNLEGMTGTTPLATLFSRRSSCPIRI